MSYDDTIETSAQAEQKLREIKKAISIKVDQLDCLYTQEGQQELNKLLEQHVHWTSVRNDLKARGLWCLSLGR